YYPNAKTELAGGRIHFEHDTRVFMVHTALMTGEWQEARPTIGPNPHGILCNIELVPGVYNGQAVLPQTFNECYFETLAMAVASPTGSHYLSVHLSYPSGVDPWFRKEFDDVLRDAWRP